MYLYMCFFVNNQYRILYEAGGAGSDNLGDASQDSASVHAAECWDLCFGSCKDSGAWLFAPVIRGHFAFNQGPL